MTIRRNLLISFFFICLALSNSQVYGSDKIETVTLQLIWKNQFQFAGYYVARELGFYNDVGLDVTIKEYEFGTDVTQDVLSQKAHFGVGRSALVLESMEGKDVYLLSAIFQYSPFMLLAKKRDDLKQVSDLKGKRIMVTDDFMGMASLTAMLLANGIKSDSYSSQKHTFNIDDLISGKTDAVASYISNEPYQMEKRGIDYTIFAPKDHGFNFYSDILFTSQGLYKDNPELVKRFYQASLQGWAYAFSHIDEAVDLILKKYNTQNRRKDALLFEANTLKTLAYDKGVPLGNINKNRIAQIAQIYRLMGLTHQPLKTDNLILEDTPQIKLTSQEQAWLDKHPVVRARIGKAPPLHFFDGKPLGISVDYLNLIAKRAGFTVQYVTDIPWSKALDDIKKHETIDLLLTAKETPERRNHMAFTKDYLLMPWVIFAQKDSSIGSMEDLMDKTVAVERDYVMHKKLAAEYPDIKLLIKGTSQEAIEAVATGGADAYIGNLTIGVYIVRQNNLNNVKVAASTPFGNHDQAMAIRDDWPELAGIIDKGLAAISEKDRNEILTRYLGILSIEGSKTAQTRVALTPEEQAWISKHKVLRIGADSAWPPYDFVDGSGKHRGVAADVLALLSKRLGLSFNLVPGLTWEGILEAARERRLDIVSALTVTPERATYLKFSNPLTSAPWVIVTEKDFRPVENLGNMTKDKVAMAKDYAIIELSRQAFPDLPIRTVASPLAGLEAVMSHQMDAYVGNLGVVSYLIQQNGLTNLRIAAAAGMETPPIAIGIRSDWPELVRILNKGLESISREDMSAIYKRWIPVEMSSIQPKGEIPISFGQLIGYSVALLLVIILLAWLIFKKSSRMGIAAGFGSARFRLMVLAGLTFFIIVILLIGWFSLARIKSDILQDVEKNLRGTLLIAKQGLGLWESGRKALMKHFGDEPKLVASTEQLLKAPPDRKALAASEALREVRNYFKENKNVFPNIGFFIISPEKISIGSTRDINLGTPNLISLQYPELIKRAFEGHVGFVPPMESDIQLGKASKSDAKRPASMFFVGPIRKPDGKIIAVMTLVVDPSQDFSQAMTIAGGHGTEETYAFTQGGRLISDSKFDEHLQQIGLIGEGEKAVLNIEIRDPGVNMVEGHRPLIERSRQPLTRMATGAIALKSRMEAVGADYGYSEIEIDMAGYRDYRGVPVFGAWVWNANLKLGIATEIDVDEALSSYYLIQITVLGVLGLTFVLFVGSTLFVLRMGERTHRALTRARDDLEDKVEERTTELRKKQEQLSVAEERSHLLLYSAGEGIFGVSSEGQCTFANPSSLDMLGYTQDEIVGKDIHDLIHHTHADGTPYPAEGCPMSRAYTHGEPKTINDEMLWRKDGIGFFVEYTATPMKKDGKTVGAVVTFNDITEQKQLEKSLQIRITELADARLASLNMMEDIEESRKKAEEATQAKSDFLASMSHELRTPLNAIIGFSEVLRDQYFGELNEKQVEYTNDILESGKHLLSLINDILDLSKVEAGKMELNLSQVNIKELLKSSLVMIKEKALKRGIALDLKIPEGLSGLEIQADERKVKQVMFNLLSNAAKFTPDGGEIRVTVDLISELGIRILELKEDEKQLAIQNPKSKIEVCVADNGIGLSPENQGKIFQEFYQVRGGIMDKSPGTGLGLPLTKSFVEMHGGRIWVESKGEGKGSRFSFLLPVKFEDLEIDAGLLNNLRSLASSYEKHKRPFTLCYLQIDREHFKEEAPRIREAFVKEKRGDDILSMDKWGNVYLVIQGTDGEKIKVACNRLIKKMKSMFEGLEISYSTATFPEDGDTPEAIIKKVRKT